MTKSFPDNLLGDKRKPLQSLSELFFWDEGNDFLEIDDFSEPVQKRVKKLEDSSEEMLEICLHCG